MTAQEIAAFLNEQQIDAVMTGSATAYYDRMKPNAAQPYNVSNALWRLGVWTEAGKITAKGNDVRSLLK